MKRLFHLVARIFFFAVFIVVVYLVVIIGIGTFTDYKPKEITELTTDKGAEKQQISDSTLTFLSWNVGYFGLGAEMDFFYEGGENVDPPKEMVTKYATGILNFLKSADSVDFIILQEVDKNSERTNKLDQTEIIQESMTEYSSSFAVNYDVKFVPLPLTNPVGKVKMGQMNLSKYKPFSSQRYSYFSKYSWPKQLFMLDRCFVVSRFKHENGKELVLINTHNSAYDKEGKLREVEMPLIRGLMLEEYEKGNYVVAGGDWNQNPPDYLPGDVEKTYPSVIVEIMDSNYFPNDWKIAYDPEIGTNRALNSPLTKGKTEVTIIDFFILSPNIEVEEIKTIPAGFIHSDHEPVYLKIKIN